MYELHRAIGHVLRSIEYSDTEVLLDSACGGEGKLIRLYGGGLAGGDSALASVDAALVVNGEIRVVIEIEFSDVPPLYLCGKAFAAALSNHHVREKTRIPLGDRMMFIQVIQYLNEQPLSWPGDKVRRKGKKTSKLPQYVYLEREINKLLQDTRSRVRRYVFHYGFSESFALGGSDARALKKDILDFLPLVRHFSTQDAKPTCEL
jgi:hypothetical protein